MSGSTITPPIVFISYSHDDDAHRNWVLQLSTRLRSNGVDALLDQFNLTLGSDLATFMEKGLTTSHRVICICSKRYVEKANGGTGGAGYEKQVLTASLVRDQNTDLVIPIIRANDLEQPVPTFLDGRKYLDMRDDRLYESKYDELLRNVLGVPVVPIPPIGPNPYENIKAFSNVQLLPANEQYHNPSYTGRVTFDYTNNNGRYSIGLGDMLFTLTFSTAGQGAIHFYSDSPNIRGIAIATRAHEFEEVVDARRYNYSSRARTLHNGQIATAQNVNGFYAAIKIISVQAEDRDTGEGQIEFDYKIQTNGSPGFS
ncbi:MAG TPA: toll/interleukin-1 receptor domain-containing protein [Flavobacteriales bacterium]|nr:MAG: toll/interleukin-1 receptor domain-containing protein [Flavobacteriales bacterium]HQZ42300.1 toll/interleukin-1 receptor domain-containing protein [Flavobacteriales bacterium]